MPTAEEIDALVDFLPLLSAMEPHPVRNWRCGESSPEGVLQMPWPEYPEIVGAFFHAASRECWCDYGYDPRKTLAMLRDEDQVRSASLEQVRSMLTYCVRGERFCDGHWAAMIEKGYIRRLLERLRELRCSPEKG